MVRFVHHRDRREQQALIFLASSSSHDSRAPSSVLTWWSLVSHKTREHYFYCCAGKINFSLFQINFVPSQQCGLRWIISLLFHPPLPFPPFLAVSCRVWCCPWPGQLGSRLSPCGSPTPYRRPSKEKPDEAVKVSMGTPQARRTTAFDTQIVQEGWMVSFICM